MADTLDVVVDRGYFNSEEILACDEAGITVTLWAGRCGDFGRWMSGVLGWEVKGFCSSDGGGFERRMAGALHLGLRLGRRSFCGFSFGNRRARLAVMARPSAHRRRLVAYSSSSLNVLSLRSTNRRASSPLSRTRRTTMPLNGWVVGSQTRCTVPSIELPIFRLPKYPDSRAPPSDQSTAWWERPSKANTSPGLRTRRFRRRWRPRAQLIRLLIDCDRPVPNRAIRWT